MPVLITGAEHGPGRTAVAALAQRGGDVRALVDPTRAPGDLVERLRGAGVRTARGSCDDATLLEQAARDAHTIVHAAADPLVAPEVVLDEAASVVGAAIEAGVTRVVLVSHLGADPAEPNAWLAALGEAEDLVAEVPGVSVIVRRALTYGLDDALTDAVAEGAPGADPDALHAPLWAGDLAAAIVAADAREAPAVPHLALPLGGPRAANLGELIALLGGQIPTEPDPRLPDGSALPAHVVDLLSRDLLPARDAPSAGTSPETGGAQVRRALTTG